MEMMGALAPYTYTNMYTFLSGVLDAVAPRRCAGCDVPGAALCLSCTMVIRNLPSPKTHGPVAAAFPYRQPIDRVIQRAKYGDARTALAELAVPCVAQQPANERCSVPGGEGGW